MDLNAALPRPTSGTRYQELWWDKLLTPHQLIVRDVRLEKWRPGFDSDLEIKDRNPFELVSPYAAFTPSSGLVRASEAASNPIESQKLSKLEEQWGWVSSLRLPHIQRYVSDVDTSAVCRWIHVSSKFPDYIGGFLWALSDPLKARQTANSLVVLEQCLRKQERFSRHGRQYAPFCERLGSKYNDNAANATYPMLICVPFLDWSLNDGTPPLRFQIDKREGWTSTRSAVHPLRTILQHFYRLEETKEREKEQVFCKHRPWMSDRELDLRVRSWYGHYPTALSVDELWVLAVDEHHVVTSAGNQTWKSFNPPNQLTARIQFSFLFQRTSMKNYEESQAYNALTHSIVCMNAALGLLHRSFWPDMILPLTDRYAGYMSQLQYRLHRSPTTKLVMDLLQVQEELNIIVKLMQQQVDLLHTVARLTSSSTHDTMTGLVVNTSKSSHNVTDNAPRERIPTERLQAHIDDAASDLTRTLESELSDLRELLDNTNTLVNRTVQLVNIRLEDHGKAILVFTIITIVFLPLNFVTSFFGMNFADIRNTQANQGLFWIIAACVTTTIVGLALLLAFNGGSILEKFTHVKENRSRLHERPQADLPRRGATTYRNKNKGFIPHLHKGWQ